jgi:hypothetical protein
MGHAAVLVVTVLLATALRRIERFIHGDNDVGDRDRVHAASQAIAAAGATHATHQLVAAQLAEQLLEVGQRDLLTLGNAGQRHRPIVLACSQIDHCRDGESPFGRQSHGVTSQEP